MKTNVKKYWNIVIPPNHFYSSPSYEIIEKKFQFVKGLAMKRSNYSLT